MTHVEKTERTVGDLLDQIRRSEIKLPELQRDFVWKPTQIAKLIDSLYHGYPSGSLLFWETDEKPGDRAMALGHTAVPNWRPPLYLIDGQQRLTALYRVFTGHDEAQIVFQVDQEKFQNESNRTRNDPKWIRLVELLHPEASLLQLVKQLTEAGCTSSEVEIERRLRRLFQLREHRYQMEILKDFTHKEMAEIFIRVNSGGRYLDTLDLALATLSADWPGIVTRMQDEAEHWRKRKFSDIDVNFLTRALAALAGRKNTAWTLGALRGIAEPDLEQAWSTVQRGLKRLIPLIKNNLGVGRSDVLPTVVPLLPLVVYLGSREDKPLRKETANALIYWFLVATIRNRYSGASDAKLNQDISAARKEDAVKELLSNVGVFNAHPQVTPESLAGRTRESPYFFLSLLVAQRNGALDWWYAIKLTPGLDGDQSLEHHHVHPVATLEDQYDPADINDLANLAFISAKANRKIGYRAPMSYFPEVGDEALAAHFIPLDETLRHAESYRDFLAARRELLAKAMTELLDEFRPSWLDALPAGPASVTDGMSMRMELYASAWDSGWIVFTAKGAKLRWQGAARMEDFMQAVTDAGVAGIFGDVKIADESVPVEVVEEAIEVPVGPFTLTGTIEEWEQVFERERSSMRSLSSYQQVKPAPWTADRTKFPLTSTE